MKKRKVIARYTGFGKFDYTRVKLNTGKIMLEHRFIMEEKLGRILDKHEVIHHINGSGNDNRVSNLKLVTRKTHNAEHPKEVVYISLICAACGKKFSRTTGDIRSKKKAGQENFFCKRSCRLPRTKSGDIPHGTQNGYSYYRCKCDQCRKANKDAQRRFRNKRLSSSG